MSQGTVALSAFLRRFAEYRLGGISTRTKLLGLALAAMSVALTMTLALSTHVASVSADSEQGGNLQIEKNCSGYFAAGTPAGGHCTITYSNVTEIPIGSRVFYDQAFGIPDPDPPVMLDSNVVLYVGTGDWAVGRCTLDGSTGLGLCTFSDGVGPLAGLHARIDVSPCPTTSTSACPIAGSANYSWIGTYSSPPQGNRGDK